MAAISPAVTSNLINKGVNHIITLKLPHSSITPEGVSLIVSDKLIKSQVITVQHTLSADNFPLTFPRSQLVHDTCVCCPTMSTLSGDCWLEFNSPFAITCKNSLLPSICVVRISHYT